MSIDSSNDTDVEQNPDEKKHKCNKDGCHKAFKRRFELKRHIEAHSKGTQPPTKRYKCNEPNCEAAFFESGRLQIHKLADHCGERPFKCDYSNCDKSYRNDAHLKRHKATSHYVKKDTSEQVVCKGCGNVYCNRYVLKQHMTSAHAEHDDLVNSNGNKKKSDVEKSHKCDEPGCKAAFNRPYRLKNHKLSVHAGERPFICDHEGCDKSYTNESHLVRHKNVSHTPEEIDTTKEVICGEEGCGRIFSNKYSLKKHIATCHKDFPFHCQDCDAKFKRKSHLHAHRVEVHEQAAPYKCNDCPRTFIHYHLYNKHLKNHKTYQCDCGEIFDRWSKLLQHRKTECALPPKEYKCVICGKAFALKQKLTQHSLHVHISDSQVDLLRCPYLNCNRSYKQKNNLNFHIRTYHDKLFKRIKCTEKDCEVVFKSNRNLKQHLRIVHHGLQAKVRKPRKPRKDKGRAKKSMASIISGVEVSVEENYKNIVEKTDDNLKEDVIAVLNKDGCSEKDGKLKRHHEKRTSRKTANTKNTQSNQLINCQKTTVNVVESLPLSDIGRNTEEPENCHGATSYSTISMEIDDECSRNSSALEDKTKEGESDKTLKESGNSNSSFNIENQTNFTNKLTEAMKNCDNETQQKIDDNITSDSTVATVNHNVVVIMDIDSELNNALALEMPSDLKDSGNGSKYKLVQVVEGFQSGIDENLAKDAVEMPRDVLNFNSSQGSCDSGVVVFDFPEFENIVHVNNTEALANE